MNKTSLKSKKLAKVLFAILFGATILTGCEINVSESDKTIDNPSDPSVIGEKINSVSITKMPTKTQYKVGDKFDATGLEVNVNKTTSYSDNTTKTSDVSVSYKGIEVSDNKTISVTVSEKGGNETPSTTTTINEIKVVNNVISLESLKNISALQTLSEKDKEIAKTVKTLNIEFPEKEDKTNHSVNLVDISKLHTIFPDAKISASDNTGYFKNTAQKEALKDKIIDIDGGYHRNDFNPAYSEDVASEKAQMRTLQSVAEEADESIKQQTALLDKKAQFIDPDTN